jgi:hypothetical protein
MSLGPLTVARIRAFMSPTLRRDPWPLVIVGAASTRITLFKAREAFDSDGWWHLRSGDVLLEHGFLSHRDPFSWASGDGLWIHNSWGFDVFAAALRAAGGIRLVSLVVLAAAVAFGVVAYALARRAGAGPWASTTAAIAAQLVMAPHVAERPQALSYLLFAATLVVADRALGGSNRALVATTALVAFWSNLHLAVSVGIGTAVLIAFGRGIRERWVARPAAVAGAVMLAGLLNPFGPESFTAALRVRGFGEDIEEWRHVDLTKSHDVLLILLAVLAIASLVRTRRWPRLDCSLPLIALAIASFDAVRNGPYLALLAAPELALGMSSFSRARTGARARALHRALVHGWALGLFVLSGIALRDSGSFRDATRDYPVTSTAAIPNGCRLLNEYEHGGYILDHRWPDVLVSMDGRLDAYDLDFVREEIAVLKGASGALRWLDRHDVDCVLARPRRPIVKILRDDGWATWARDPSGVLLVRTTREDGRR